MEESRVMSFRRIASTVLLLAPLLVPPSAARAKPAPKAHPSRAKLAACQIPGNDDKKVDALCGVYEVWENRTAKAGRKIGLKVVVIPALAPQPKPDPIFFFGGGPGEAIADEAGGAAEDPARQDRDLVFVNQRGTGEPSKLGCDLGGRLEDPQSFLGETFPLAAVVKCRDELAKRADLSRYGTDTAMDDIDEVRSWLGYDKINLSGGSYGTRAVQTYLRRHGETVRAAVLQGVVPTPETLPLSHAAGAQRSLDLLLSWCDQDPACHGKFPHVHEELAAIMDQLAQNPVEADVKMPGAEKPVHVRLARGVMADGVRWMLYTPRTGALLPLLIHEAAAGNWGPLGQAAVVSRLGVLRALAMGMFFSVTCSEDVALIDPATIAARTAGTFFGDYRVRQQIAACAVWPHFQIAPETKLLFRSAVPILLISGERDPVTPPAFGDLARRGYTHSLHLVFPYGSHGIEGDCVDRLQREFIARGGFDGLDTSCVAATTLPPFVLELPKEIGGPLG
jgi:pimeloyl-ACP methyl ester carboxylesterase